MPSMNNSSVSDYQSLKKLYGTALHGPSPIYLPEEEILTEMFDTLKRWEGHFSALLNMSTYVQQDSIDGMKQRNIRRSGWPSK